MKTIHKEILCCLETKVNELQAAIDAMPTYGSTPPAHPWETSLLNEGSREYDDPKDLMWTLVENPVAATSWFWVFDLSVGPDADGDGLADEQIDVIDALAAINFSILPGADIVQEIMSGFGLCNGVPTLCHRNGSVYYIWQNDSGTQANPLIQGAVELDAFYGVTSITSTPAASTNLVASRWVNKPVSDS